ncbi:MAG TPA: polyamine aminopropyltransferase [Aquificaceae bacterium]|nr:polyamine aminopropyltransferase [Aquificaceae bacterium]
MNDIIFIERDPYAPVRHCYRVSAILYEGKSEYQEILVLESPEFGKLLVLDGVVQLDEKYEFLYHEFLAHVPMYAHPNPENVLIVGGGDGGTLREVLKHEEVRRAVLVDIDREVIEVSKRFFPSLSRSFEDPRAIVINEDGYKYIQDCEEEFDVIIVDSTDPVGFAHVLTTEEFFRLAFRALREEGIFAAQTESLHYHLDMVVKTQKSLRKVFPVVDLYTSVVPIYAGYWWTYSIASKKHPVREPCRKVQANTKIYSEEMHRYAFLPTSFYERVLSGDFKY